MFTTPTDGRRWQSSMILSTVIPPLTRFSQQLTVEGRRLAAAAGAAEAVLDDLQPGDAVVHHCQTVHRAEENTAPARAGGGDAAIRGSSHATPIG